MVGDNKESWAFHLFRNKYMMAVFVFIFCSGNHNRLLTLFKVEPDDLFSRRQQRLVLRLLHVREMNCKSFMSSQLFDQIAVVMFENVWTTFDVLHFTVQTQQALHNKPTLPVFKLQLVLTVNTVCTCELQGQVLRCGAADF